MTHSPIGMESHVFNAPLLLIFLMLSKKSAHSAMLTKFMYRKVTVAKAETKYTYPKTRLNF